MKGQIPTKICTAVILAGGLNSRMQGRNKAFLRVGGRPILDRLLASLHPLFEDIILVTRQPELYEDRSFEIVTDIFDARSSLTGIHAGLVKAKTEHIFVVPCDTPFLKTALVSRLLEALSPQVDIVVPRVEGHFQPLCAIYSKRCIPVIEEHFQKEAFKIIDIFNRMRVKTVSAAILKPADPSLHSFFNVNTPADFEACHEIVKSFSG